MKKKNLSSRMKHCLTLQTPVLTADGAGGFVTVWQDVATLWAEVTKNGGAPYFGNESGENRSVQSTTRYLLTLRYNAQITTKMRFLYESRVLQIIAVTEPLGNKEITEVIAEEQKP